MLRLLSVIVKSCPRRRLSKRQPYLFSPMLKQLMFADREFQRD